jgi:hypothetical protein
MIDIMWGPQSLIKFLKTDDFNANICGLSVSMFLLEVVKSSVCV